MEGTSMVQESENKSPNDRSKNPRRVALTILLPLIFVAIALTYYFWRRAQIYITTDDAYVHGHIHMVSSRVAGTVIDLFVDDNQLIEKGQLLVRLDPEPFELLVRDAQAALELAKNEVAQLKASVQAAEARLSLAKATLEQAELDLDRITNLVKDGVVPKETLDKTLTGREAAAAGVRAAAEELRRARAALGSTSAEKAHPLILKRQAELEQAELNLGYTEIHSPAKGNVTRKSVEVGNRLQPGQPLMSIVPLDDVWIVANYKETQLKRVRVGQPVEIRVDTYPGLRLNGRVESIMAGTGAVFSLFPPENATGNFVKVVQRIPVKIVLGENPNPKHVLLRVGMSVVPTIDTTAN
ncbi:MAG: HlyD family secretion protein [Candidatus Hydrogenedentota bacterium]|nr:MAG: HlyD family secretion protein [Candidatus Hydrogenedentota bacterium]